MKICIAQVKPVIGDIPSNIRNHLSMVNLAVAEGAAVIIFPELSITGYEPSLAQQLAITTCDRRFAVFQHSSNTHNITIGVGVPIQTAIGLTISLLIFQPQKERAVYAKQYLHPDEEPFFVGGSSTLTLIGEAPAIALAICYELSVPQHAANAAQNGAAVYLASVAKSAGGVEKAAAHLAQIAREHSMPVLMVNCFGINDGMTCAGRSAVWNNRGELLGQLDDSNEGILLFDTATQNVIAKRFQRDVQP